jgi:hypothetical protein
MKPHSLVVECGGLGDDGVGDGALADVVEAGGVAQPGQLLGVDVHPAGDIGGELGDAVEVVAQVGMALGQRAQQDVAALPPGGGPVAVLLGVHGLVGLSHRLGGVARVYGEQFCDRSGALL